MTLGCFTFIFSKNEGNRFRIVKKIQIFDRAETRRTRLSSLTLKRYARKHFGCPQTDFVLNYRYCFLP